MEPHNPLLLIISFSPLLFFYSADAICVPRNFTHPIPPPPKLSPPPRHVPSPPPKSPPLAPSNPDTPSPSPLSFPPFSLVNPEVKKICDITDYPALCLSAVAPILIGKVSPLAVLEKIIKACIIKSQLALAVATRIAHDPTTGNSTASYLDSCKDSYSDAMDNLQSAADAMSTRDTGTMNIMLSAAMTDFSTCEEGFQETPGVNSPMADWDDMLSKLASIGLAIVTLIK